VKFGTLAEVKEAIQTLNGSSELGRPIRVSEATGNRIQKKEERVDSTSSTLFIRDIDPEIVKEETLLHHFRPYGNVLSVKVIPGHPDWANVTMETHVEAECAKNALQGTQFGGTTKCTIEFGRAIEEHVGRRVEEISIPVIKEKRVNKKLQAEFFSDAGVERIMDVMQRFAEMNRLTPIGSADVDVANREYERSMLSVDELLFDWGCVGVSTGVQTFWHF
jgi:hypothetical protein